MRLHRLEITAFGPFSGTEEIDFDALSDAGLFLIQGRTGAGKTSVLDAVCFALYGQVPGARNAVKGLRSDHAPDGLGPRVVLETTIRGRRLRVSRSPAWDRPKLRGSGVTTEKARVVLEEREPGGWVGLSTRLDEAGDLISRLLGMNPTQFCQVALLPQGEFAGFLRAGADERRKVLERLFATEVFTQVEKWLADRRAATRREAAELSGAAASIAEAIAETTGARPPHGRRLVPEPRQGEPLLEPVETLPAWATELAAGHDAVRAIVEDLRAEVAATLTAARSAAQRGADLAERQRRHAGALARRAMLREHAEERSDLTSRLDTAARADRAASPVRHAAERAGRAAETRRRADYARAQVNALVTPNAAWDVLAKSESARREEAAALDARRGDVARLRQIDADRAVNARRVERAAPEEARLTAAVAELPARVEAHRAALDEARLASAGRQGAEAAVTEIAHRLDAARRRDRVEGLLAAADEARSAAIDAAQRARDRVQDLRQARLDGMAAVLAAELADGEPCRVCGSREHPAPGASLADVPTEEGVERAQAAYERAQAARETAASEVERRRAERDALVEIARDLTPAALGDELAAAKQALAAVDARAAEAVELEGALHRAQRELDETRDRRDRLVRELAGLRAGDGPLLAERDRLSAELDRARGDDPTLEARVDRLVGEAAALADAADALRLAERAAEELAGARDRAAKAARDEGFRSPDEVLAAELSDEDQAVLRDRIRRFDDEEAAIRDLLADPALRAAAAEPAPDLPSLQAALDSAESAHTAAASAADRARQRCDRLADHRARLAAAVAAWRPAAERHEVAERMAGLASGKSTGNRRDMSLSAYVLAARLEQVVAAANDRLDRMSAKRYALVHTTDKAAGDRSKGGGGLGLRVADAWTGLDRDPVTLSGGESFITSLALALGLADVVTAEAGGTEINTLFVDEGFGTLDEETLDEVMDVLDALRDGGRAVGIVSHVAELRARIPAQLRITKQRAGSTATVAV
ncbi:AAA family ATPase [Actinomadura xylanilytica]|uniref:AAA family ATPase n=1 Tax=Actinomadura xylanilytica TaxID=887459 RepID=UPI00255B23CF|nr:SMC family ATPase [Actinomadura xylanilytica]MDL4774678.1 SMC family ATPase [Actinomadura xylanilytica]